VSTGVEIDPGNFAFDGANNRLFIDNRPSSTKTITILDLVTNDNSMLSSPLGFGAGPAFFSIVGLDIDPVKNLVYVSTHTTDDTIMKVDMASGDRAIVADNSTGAGPDFMHLGSSIYDQNCKCVFVIDVVLNAVLAVEPISGDRVILSK
jgi:DNA-binding beta-propeller fold protein YncE